MPMPHRTQMQVIKRRLIGKSFTRLDGPAKSTGRAKYS